MSILIKLVFLVLFLPAISSAGPIFSGGGGLPGQSGNSGKYLTTDGTGASWGTPAGAGDMEASTYDPTSVAGDAFDMANMVEAADAKVLTSAERTSIGTALQPADLAPVVYDINSQNVVVGTVDAGSYTDLAAADATTMDISEPASSPAIDIQFTFGSVANMNNVLLYGYYDGSESHEVHVQIYNNDTTAWEGIGSVVTGAASVWHSFPVIDGANYIDGSGNVLVRVYHSETGNPSHDLFLDLVQVRYSASAQGGVTTHSALSGLDSDDHMQYALADGTRGVFYQSGDDPAFNSVNIVGAPVTTGTGSSADGGIVIKNATNNFYFSLGAPVATETFSWTPPTAPAGGDNYLINADADGTMGYTAPSVFQTALSLGTGVETALGNNVGSAGAPVVFNGDAGTPSALVLTNATGLPASSVSGSTSASISFVDSVFWPAGSLSSDGTQCAVPVEVTINSGPKQYAIVCADNDASIIYGHVLMPDGWNAGTVTFELEYLQSAADTGALNADVAAQCHAAGETVNNTWGTEVAIDDAAVTGSNGVDTATSAAVTPAGTCAAGDSLWWYIAIDATGTDTAVATLNILGVKMEYTRTLGD
jgi:hypothetical protein